MGPSRFKESKQLWLKISNIFVQGFVFCALLEFALVNYASRFPTLYDGGDDGDDDDYDGDDDNGDDGDAPVNYASRFPRNFFPQVPIHAAHLPSNFSC